MSRSSCSMVRNRVYQFLSWNVRGLNDPAKYFRSVGATGAKGGLLTAWNPSLFDLIDERADTFSLSVALRRKSDGRVLSVSNIYGPACATFQQEFFRQLRSLEHFSRGVWVALGDFNTLLSPLDKNGTLSSPTHTLLFKELVRDLGLFDLPLLNKSYTWTNARRSPTLERLDRALISQDWQLLFPLSFLRALPRPRSDYSPIVLSAHTFMPSPNLFRFESFWFRCPSIGSIINQAWSSSGPYSNLVQRFASRIKSVQLALRSWSAGLTTLIKVESDLSLAWIDWLDRAEGTRALTEAKCSCLGVEQPPRATVNLVSLYGGEDFDLSSLQAPFTVDEVELAIFLCAPDKVPGPDGFPMLFYQRFWSILKADVMELFECFYNGTLDLSGLNCSWICPIPKKKSVVSARDLRPISLVHSLPKIFSKVFTTRLQCFMDKLINLFQGAFIKGRYIFDNFLTAHILIHHLHNSKQQAALLKIDFERDHINWHFLLELL
ncbi:uncharacterized protein LOC109717514 [Ananas comosus]|uniref:Uncharacterized protein LOC109717514 n=1 Tax=Ananas comosus TaxID=4615 RepID=A0A6P5FRJ2_ANACO|nr:uncharacterized protein LOC109717514 [Ananas comosus]